MPERSIIVIMKNRRSERLRFALGDDCKFVYLSDLKFSKLQRLLSKSGRVLANRGSNESFYRLVAQQLAREFTDRKTVIVSLDNSNHLVAEFRRAGVTCPILLVQHGANSVEYGSLDASTLSDSLLLCFGRREVSQYVLSGYRPEFAVPIGSLLNSHYIRNNPRIPVSQVEARVCIMSEYRSDGDDQLDNYMIARQDSWDLLLESIRLLPRILPLSLHVALRPSDSGSGSAADQIDYFRKRLGNELTFSVPNSPFSSHTASDSSRVTLGLISTTLIESLGRGNKVIFSNPLADNRLNSPLKGVCEHRGQNSRSLIDRIGEVHQIQLSDFESQVLPSVEHVIERKVDAVDAVRSAIEILRVGNTSEDLATQLGPLLAKSET
jgi:hypothetical protein